MLRLCEGSVRRALSEPSIGSITTRAVAAGAEGDLAALLGDREEGGALCGQRLELDEDGVLAAAVDRPGCGRRPRRPPRRRCAPRSRAPRRRPGAGPRRRGGKFPASLRKKRPSAGLYGALALGDGPDASTAPRDRVGRRAPAAARRAPARARPRSSRGGWRGSPRRARGRSGSSIAHLDPGDRAAPAAPRRGAPRAAPTRSSGSGPGRRSPSASCATDLPRPPGSTPSSRSSAAPSGSRSCSTTSTSCRCAARRSAATRPACWPACWSGSTRSRRGAEQPEPDLAELCAAHDRILAEAGSIDRGDLFLILNRTLGERPDVREAIAARFTHWMVDEYEETTAGAAGGARARWRRRTRTALRVERVDRPGARGPAGGDVIVLEQVFRQPRAAVLALHQRAGAGAGGGPRRRAPAGDRHLAGRDLRAGRGPGRQGRPGGGGDGGARHPASTSPGPAALFQRPEVRDAIAWLRVLADPGDSAAAARALTRPPIELRSADLARLTTIARRRKLDMVSACEAALESPQITPEARERIQSFLKLYGTASAAMEERRADVFVRRLIERGRAAAPAPLRRPARGRRAAARALAAGRAGLDLGAARAARLDPRLRPLPERGRRGRASSRPAARSRPRRAR